MENIENEISRINLDKLNTENQIFSLKETLNQQEKKKKEKEELVNKYDIIIKENIEAHERKMNEIGKFNKEHDKAMQKMNQVGTGPNENQLVVIQKETADFQLKRKQLEGEFIKSQTKAVDKEI